MSIELKELKELIASFEEWISFTNLLQQISEETWNSSIEQGKWTVKDIVSHIMLWDKYFYEEAIEKIASDKPVTLRHLNYDDFNSEAIEYGKTITTNELLEKAVFYRKKIIGDISSLSEETVNRSYLDGSGHVFSIPQYLKDFIWHDQHHMVPLKEYLKTIHA
ncbi:DinB family protein [Paenibacillus eucommiae]|uniref:Poly-D-alanine transfer protein DltD n=1 Tax=Paenibacillus eucommiae TaxID=1355755 RepID=A0ABS4IQS5_9BACL|nr:DinB family protein [Paenibacillus eucommiae]MBP1989341.1 poly-D-alanine transfer protein DltD [Paenibacillus eucommiae]